MAASFYRTDGLVSRAGQQIQWFGMNGETDATCYSVRVYADGEYAYLVNEKRVATLPNTPTTRELLRRWNGAK